MNYYLYGFVETDKLLEYGPIGFDIEDKGKGLVAAIPYRDIGVVVGPSPFRQFEGLDRESLVRTLLSHQKTLEEIMKKGFVLPCKFGTVLEKERELKTVLSQNQNLLSEWLQKMAPTCEINVVITWNTHAMLKEIAERDASISGLKKRILEMDPKSQDQGKIALGKRLSEKLMEKAGQFSCVILKTLKEVSIASAHHGCMNDGMVCNTSFLISRSDQEKFFVRINELDGHFEGKLNFKCVGPLPPYSFATVILKRFPQNEIEEAIGVLGLKGKIDLSLLKKKYKERSRVLHPDASGREETSETFRGLHHAYEFLKAYCGGGLKPVQLSLVDAEGSKK